MIFDDDMTTTPDEGGEEKAAEGKETTEEGSDANAGVELSALKTPPFLK